MHIQPIDSSILIIWPVVGDLGGDLEAQELFENEGHQCRHGPSQAPAGYVDKAPVLRVVLGA